MANFKTWMAQVRANFLVLSVFLVLLGLAFSVKYPAEESDFSFIRAALIMIGVISAHISVNLFNEYSDFFTRIDYHTKRTPFSGGSGMLVQGRTNPGAVLRVAVITLLIPFGIGIYLSIVAHWSILVFALIGAFSIVFYTPLLSKYMLGELFAGIALGTLVVIGTYIGMNAEPGMVWKGILPVEIIWLSIPPGILTALLLLINQFPDVKADIEGGRKHLVIRLGKKKAAWIYASGMFATFTIIVLLPLAGIASFWIYLGLLPLPLGLKASITAIRHSDNDMKLIPALGSNVITVLGVDLMLAVAIFIEVL